jgi:hypothetical protein
LIVEIQVAALRVLSSCRRVAGSQLDQIPAIPVEIVKYGHDAVVGFYRIAHEGMLPVPAWLPVPAAGLSLNRLVVRLRPSACSVPADQCAKDCRFEQMPPPSASLCG